MRLKHLVVFGAVLAAGSAFALKSAARPAAAATGVPTTLDSNTNPSHLGQSVTFSGTVHGVFPNLPVGGVIFLDGPSPMNAPAVLVPNFVCVAILCAPDGTSTATFTTSNLSGGTHFITAAALSQYGPSSSDTLVQTVLGATTATSVTAAPAPPTVFGQGVTFTATVVANPSTVGPPTGTVRFTDNGGNLGGTQTLNAGSASVTSTTLAVGTHNVVATYTSDSSNFLGSTGSLSQQVDMASTVTGLVSTAAPSVFGQPITITATVGAVAPGAGSPTGQVAFSDGTTSLGSVNIFAGHAAITTPAFSVGSHSITAVYSGDANFKASNGTLTQTVIRAPTDTTLTSSANPSVFGQKVSFTATVCPLPPSTAPNQPPSGMVSFTLDGAATPFETATISAGSAPPACESATSAAIGPLSVATHHVTVSYSGDGNFVAGDSGVYDQVVNKAPTATGLTAVPAGSVGFGHPVTFTGTVSVPPPGAGSPTGQMVFTVDGTPVGTVNLNSAMQASISTASLSPGSHIIGAGYQGDGNFLASSGTIIYLVTCSLTITGNHPGAVIASGDSTCIVNATIGGTVVVPKGTSLAVENSTINGSISAPNSANAIRICGATVVGGAVTVINAQGLVIVGDPGDANCPANNIHGALILQNNHHGVEAINNTVATVVVSDNSGPGPFPGDVTTISGNHR